MRDRSKLLIAATGAIALMGMAVSSASATHLQVNNWEAGFRIAWRDFKIGAGGREADCPVTLEGTYAAHTFVKRTGASVGAITEGAVGPCIRGGMTILRASLPWEVTYQSFSGTLPNIMGVTLNLLRVSIQVNIEGIVCLLRTESSQPARGIMNVSPNGEIRTFTMDTNAGIELELLVCPIAGAFHFSNTGNATVRGSTATNTISLI